MKFDSEEAMAKGLAVLEQWLNSEDRQEYTALLVTGLTFSWYTKRKVVKAAAVAAELRAGQPVTYRRVARLVDAATWLVFTLKAQASTAEIFTVRVEKLRIKLETQKRERKAREKAQQEAKERETAEANRRRGSTGVFEV